MKTFAVTVSNKKQEHLLTDFANGLGIEIKEAKFKPLTSKNVALGIGRKFTDEELDEYLLRTSGGKGKEVLKVKAGLTRRLAKKFSSK